MNPTSVNSIQAVWLDPFSPIGETERAQLEAAGIRLQLVSTLGELAMALHKAHALIIRLGDSAELLQEVQMLIGQLGQMTPILCRVERRRMEVTVDAMRLGAFHVLPADEWSVDGWKFAVEGLNISDTKTKSYVFVDPTSQHLLALAQRVAQTDVTSLLVGPTGTGKEVLARVLHESSPRAKGPFVALNCAALPEHLIEDMLFGHEKGAFTGAQKDYKGLFEQAHGGTVLLDEIGEMPIHLQAKLLRVLQEKKLIRLGGETLIDLDVRVIAATNKDLRAAIEAREFREDLYFRISTFRLRIQPLKERSGDILPLVNQSLARYAKDGRIYSVNEDAQELLLSYSWPGNVRELENVVQRAVVLSSGSIITPAHLMFDESQIESMQSGAVEMDHAKSPVSTVTKQVEEIISEYTKIESVLPQATNLDDAVKTSEKHVIMLAIQNSDNRIEAAKKLGISPRTLRYKLAQFRDRGMVMEGIAA